MGIERVAAALAIVVLTAHCTNDFDGLLGDDPTTVAATSGASSNVTSGPAGGAASTATGVGPAGPGSGGGASVGAGGQGGAVGTGDPDTCPGAAVALTSAGITIMGDTQGAANDTGMLPCGGGSSGDFVYAVNAARAGTLTATLDGAFATHLYARSQCPGQEGDDLVCSATHMPAVVTLSVSAGQTIYLFVDGFGGSAEEGPFTLTLELN